MADIRVRHLDAKAKAKMYDLFHGVGHTKPTNTEAYAAWHKFVCDEFAKYNLPGNMPGQPNHPGGMSTWGACCYLVDAGCDPDHLIAHYRLFFGPDGHGE